MKTTIIRIRQSVDAIIPDKARSNPSEKNQLSDMAFALSVEDDVTYTADDSFKRQAHTAPLRRNDIQKGLSFLFGEE